MELRRAISDHVYGSFMGALAGAATLALLSAVVLAAPWTAHSAQQAASMMGLAMFVAFLTGLASFGAGILTVGWLLRAGLALLRRDRPLEAAVLGAFAAGAGGVILASGALEPWGLIATIATAGAIAGLTYRKAALS